MNRTCDVCGSDMLYVGETTVRKEPKPVNEYTCKNPNCPETVYVSQVIDR